MKITRIPAVTKEVEVTPVKVVIELTEAQARTLGVLVMWNATVPAALRAHMPPSLVDDVKRLMDDIRVALWESR